jgi:hypothetical protein
LTGLLERMREELNWANLSMSINSDVSTPGLLPEALPERDCLMLHLMLQLAVCCIQHIYTWPLEFIIHTHSHAANATETDVGVEDGSNLSMSINSDVSTPGLLPEALPERDCLMLHLSIFIHGHWNS